MESRLSVSQQTFATFKRCLQSQLNKSEFSTYRNDPQFIDAIQSVLSNKVTKEKKRVSFSSTVEKKKSGSATKSTTLKSSSSKEKIRKESADVNYENFEKFFRIFRDNFAETGFTNEEFIEGRPSLPKTVHFISNRQNESETEGENEGKEGGSNRSPRHENIQNYSRIRKQHAVEGPSKEGEAGIGVEQGLPAGVHFEEPLEVHFEGKKVQ